MRPGLPDPLLELLGARWSMGAPVTGTAWLGASCVGFGLADGTVAIARAGWEGAAQLQPREGGGVQLVPASTEPPPVMRVGVHVGPCLALAASGESAVSGGADGRFASVAADGTVATLANLGAPIDAVAGHAGFSACANGRHVQRFGAAAGTLDVAAPVAALAFDPGGRTLAIGHADGVVLWSDSAHALTGAAGAVRALTWSDDGRFLLAGLADGTACAWAAAGGDAAALGNTPEPSLSASFSAPCGVFATSGAKRVVCWSLDRGAAHRRECGPGSTASVSVVACHPLRRLIAAGYENGAVLLCQPDGADLLFVRMAGGGAVASLAWSATGGHLAIGAAGGEVGIVTFPDLLFRAAPRTETRGMNEDDTSKDRFFERLGLMAEEMIAAHGKDFAMGTLVLAARFIAEGKPLGRSGRGGLS